PCTIGVESTIVDFVNGEPIILRQGGVSLESIENTLNREVKTKTSSSRPVAPGMLDIHYAPKVPVVIDTIDHMLEKLPAEKIGYLAFNKSNPKIPRQNQFVLSKTGNLTEAAQNFFYFLRKLDALDLALLVAEYLPEEDLGRAINDKLRRAATRYENLNLPTNSM
ncbi:MAG: L-threonylcarbamoyladenylate synthase type 1 TsaC, partial [Saprospiraceae bacterium]|nr:L-threonylcarbamoyladenylate synthase type 1 TsaC [Saprospiraceae bacterium]